MVSIAKTEAGQFKLIQQRLDSIRKEIPAELEKAMDDLADEIVIAAQDIIQQEAFDTGALFSSGKVEITPVQQRGSRKRLSRTITFGGRTRAGATKNAPNGIVEYADIVHEVGTGGKGPPVKFLQRALNEKRSKILGIFRTAVKDIVR